MTEMLKSNEEPDNTTRTQQEIVKAKELLAPVFETIYKCSAVTKRPKSL